MKDNPLVISSLGNPRVKNVVKLRQRSHRDDMGLMIVEGYREILRALDNAHFPKELFHCRDLFQGKNNDALLNRSREAGTELVDCSVPVFKKISYRDRPDGLLALAPQVHFSLQDLDLGDSGGVHSGDDSKSVFESTRPVSIHRSKLLEHGLTDLCRRNKSCH